MLISIIIPVYNKEEYLNDCIKSVVYQDYHDIEIIIINDGSQDNSASIIKKWVEKDTRIQYISQENKGVSFTRNRGISMAKGEYIYLLDADDFLEKNAISKLVYYAESTKADIIIGNFYEKNGEKVIKKPRFKNRLFNIEELESTETMLEMFIVNGRHMAKAGNKLYKLNFIKKYQISFEENVIAEDRLFNLICYVNRPIIQIVNEYTYIYNTLDNSRSRTLNSKYYDESIALVDYFYDYLKKNSRFEQYIELFQLTVLYDVQKIINQTFEYAERKFANTNSTIKKLRENSLVMNTIHSIFTEHKYRKARYGNVFFRIRLMNYLLLKAPYLINLYKIIGYMSRGIRKNLPILR